MRQNIIKSIVLGLVGLAALIWGLSYGVSGLAWFPGALVAVTTAIKIYDLNRKEDHVQDT